MNEATFPLYGTCGVQGGQPVIFVSVTMRELDRLITRDNSGHALERSQRELNQKRASAVAGYLKKAYIAKKPFIIPPLVGNCDGDIKIEMLGDSRMAEIRVPFSSKIKLFDGQHRLEGCVEFLRDFPEAGHNTVALMLTIDQPLNIRQQFFSDINNNASKPAAAVSMAYDGNNALAKMVQSSVVNNENLSGKVDFEHNLVPSKSPYWVSFKAICDATQKITANLNENREGETVQERVDAVWHGWTMFTGLTEASRSCQYADYRKDWITFHGVTVNAFGWAIQELLKEMPFRVLISKIEVISLTATTQERDEFFLTENWKGICVDRERGTLKADVRSQKEAGKRLATAIRDGKFTHPQEVVDVIETSVIEDDVIPA